MKQTKKRLGSSDVIFEAMNLSAADDEKLPAATKSTDQGLKAGWTRTTVVIRKDYLEKLKAKAYWDRTSLRDLLDAAIGDSLKGEIIKPKGKK